MRRQNHRLLAPKVRYSRGFTLIELLSTVVIVGLLASVALPNFMGQTDKARTTEATGTLDAIKSSQQVVLMETGQYTSVGNVRTGNCYPSVVAGRSAGIVDTPGNLADFQSALALNLDANLLARWNFATRPSISNPYAIKMAAEASGPQNTGMGVYYDNSAIAQYYGTVAVDSNSRDPGPAVCS